MAFAQVQHVRQGEDGGHQFVVAKNSLQGRFGKEPAVVEKPLPKGAPAVPYKAVVAILDEQDPAAIRAGIQQFIDGLAAPAGQAGIFEISPGDRDQVRLEWFGKGLNLHGISFKYDIK
jgi:hypothetical protein